MKIVVALDSFKGTFTAQEACRIVSKAFREAFPDANVVESPLADGGEGTGVILRKSLHAQWIPVETYGPHFQMKLQSGYSWSKNCTWRSNWYEW